MTLFVLPINIADINLEEFVPNKSEDKVLLSNPVIQKKTVDLSCVGEVLVIEDFVDIDKLTYLNTEAKKLATGWVKHNIVEDILTFNKINIGSLFYIENVYFFIGVLKALKVAESVVQRYKDDEICLFNDGSFWADTFLRVAAKNEKKLKVIHEKKNSSGNKISIKERVKNIIKVFLSILNFMGIRSNKPSGSGRETIIYSCALKFCKDLFKFSSTDNPVYYVRPIFSLKAFNLSRRDLVRRMFHILPDYYVSFKDRITLLREVDQAKLFRNIDEFFDKEKVLKYNGYDMWPLFRNNLNKMFEDYFIPLAIAVKGFDEMFRNIRPDLIVVDEDTTPFNKALVECAKLYKVPSVQLNHGILGHSLLKVPINSDKLAAFGESSRERLVGWGVPDEKIEVVGMPCLDGVLSFDDMALLKKQFISEFGIDENEKIVTLATSPFRTEERADFMDSFLTPLNIRNMLEIGAKLLKTKDNIRLVVKFHPREKNEWFTHEIFSDEKISEKIIFLKDYNLSTVLSASDLVLTYGTTVFYDSLLMQIPVLLFDTSEKRLLRFLSERYLDLSDKNRAVSDIVKMLNDDVERAERLKSQQMELEWHFVDKNKNADEKVLKLFHSLIDKRKNHNK